MMEGWGQGMSSLPWTRGQGGGYAASVPPPQHQALQGHQCQQDRAGCCCAQGTASPWQFCISPPKTSTFPLFPIPGKTWEALLHPAVLPFPGKTVTGSFSASGTLPAKSISPLSSLPGKVTGAGISPLHGALAVAGSAVPQDAPREQPLPASNSKGLQGVQGGHSPAGC